jgi:hypothetical protein
MKKFNVLYLCSTLILLLSPDVTAQRAIVNTEWLAVNGAIGQYDWSSTCTDSFGRLCLTGNDVDNMQLTNMLVTRYNYDGSISWQSSWNGATNGDDYGIAIVCKNSNLYVCGASFNTLNNDFDYVVQKYALETGILQWTYLYADPAGGMDIPSDIGIDPSGNVLVTGARQGSTSLLDYCTLSINDSGNLNWVSVYDHSNKYDAAAKIAVDYLGNSVVTGGSGDSWSDNDFCSVWYSASGTQMGVKRSESPATSFDLPTDMKVDQAENVYVTGRIGTNNQGNDIKLIKMDSDFNILWTITKDGFGHDDMANSLALDADGNIYITGYCTNSSGKKELLVSKYDNWGGLIWKKFHQSPELGDALGWELTVLGDRIGIVGDIKTSLGMDVYFISYSPSGELIWSKTVDGGMGQDDSGRHTHFVSENEVYVSGKVSGNNQAQYLNIKYETWNRVQSVGYFGSEPKYVSNELIIWFQPSVVDLNAVNNKNKIYGSLEDFISMNTITELNQVFGSELKAQKTVKVFEHWKSSYQSTLTRDGELLNLPPYWSCFVLTLPDGVSALNASATLREANLSSIKLIDLNWLYFPFSDANDAEYGLQESLFENDALVRNHINVEPAWNIETGKLNVKCGIFDTGIEWSHQDFGDGTYSGSIIYGGWDWVNQQPIEMLQSDDFGHGTAVTGIIGAKRNNNLGVAGIAGGNWEDPNNPIEGVQLFSFKIMNDLGGQGISTDNVVDALIEGAICVPDNLGSCSFGYALNVMNNSWGTQSFPPENMSEEDEIAFTNHQNLMGEAVYEVARNGCVNSMAAGNASNNYGSSPANTFCPENYALQIGSSNIEGKKRTDSNYGKIDFVAPGDPNIVFTTSNGDESYTGFSKTLAAAPHVAGIASLMISYINNNPLAPNQLHPEDVERLLEKNAFDVNIPGDLDYPEGPDEFTQYGIVDAGKTLENIQLPYFKVHHFSANLNSGDVSGTSEGTFIVVEGNPIVPNGNYLADVFQYTKVIPFDVGPETVLDAWTRDAHSTPVDCSNILERYPNIELTAFNSSSATVTGCVYHFTLQVIGGSLIPVDIWYPHNTNTGSMAITVYTHDETVGVSNMVSSDTHLACYPNPTQFKFHYSY